MGNIDEDVGVEADCSGSEHQKDDAESSRTSPFWRWGGLGVACASRPFESNPRWREGADLDFLPEEQAPTTVKALVCSYA
ncbi:hypothetical protein C6341_g25170 [Phytophthora cactorum]|nr:hypothetical protein PC122_g22616 [Phytophthora cactorum]KAG3126912.1 hypothetical protein C6341_g25170 [Phytophthora cactorum]